MSQFNSYALSSRSQRGIAGSGSRQSMWRGSSGSSGNFRRNQNTVAFRSSKTLGPVAHTVLVALMLAVLGLIYLTQITKTSTYGYEMNELEARQSELMSRKQDLEVENARLQALERVKESDVARSLDRPSSVEYAN